MTQDQRESLTITVPGMPPSGDASPGNIERLAALVELTKKTSCCKPTKEPIALSIRHIRGNGKDSPTSILGGVVTALRGLLFENESQVNELNYSERPGEREHYQVSASPLGFQIPFLFEPVGEIGSFKADPAKFFPDDAASRWMLGLLLANEDIGLAMKMVSTYMGSPTLSVKPHAQYRTSHMLYFWRLWLAHIHEAWDAFNKGGDDPIIKQVKGTEAVKKAFRTVADLRGQRVVRDLTAAELFDKCRHVTFHYYEEDGDDWANQLKKLPADFEISLTHGDYRDVDSRWLIADEYLLSRLNPLEFGSKEMHKVMADIAIDTMGLIRTTQKEYFNVRQPGFLDAMPDGKGKAG
jgi:hypothetical protein